jgi:hypothetical protein
MKQTAVEWLIKQIKSKADNLPTNTKENRMAKGIYVDCLLMARQAKEMEKEQQGYSEEKVIELIQFLAENEVFKDCSSISIFTAEDFLNKFKNK